MAAPVVAPVNSPAASPRFSTPVVTATALTAKQLLAARHRHRPITAAPHTSAECRHRACPAATPTPAAAPVASPAAISSFTAPVGATATAPPLD